MKGKPRIGLTMGDAAGVGPELVLRALEDTIVREQCDLVVFGDESVLERVAERVGLKFPDVPVVGLSEYCKTSGVFDSHAVVDLGLLRSDEWHIGEVSAACGDASFQFIQAAMQAAEDGKVGAVTTCPINKEALHLAGHQYPGHTEMFAERTASDRWCMMQYSEEITCSFVTVHVGYAEVPKLVTKQRVLDTILLTGEALKRIRGIQPRLVVCGLNPHAGEGGLFGDGEEETAIRPAIEDAIAKGWLVEGPLPPDTAFLAEKRQTTDAFVCMYHDQGHIPVKALAFDAAVNTTLGVDMVRTSVDHGTAFDIAWKGVARPNSLFCALRLAAKLAQ